MLNFKQPSDRRRSERDILGFELKSRWTKGNKFLNALSEIFVMSFSARMRYSSLISDILCYVFDVTIFRRLPVNSTISVLPGNFVTFMSLHVQRSTGHNSFDGILPIEIVVPLYSKNKRITHNCIILTLDSEYEVIGWTRQWDWSVKKLLSYFSI